MKATPDIFYRKIKSDKESTPPIFVSVKLMIIIKPMTISLQRIYFMFKIHNNVIYTQ